ncbi:MAG: homocysteine S-methyltransferase family protein, partial [Chloroflexi bacterium]|nr:homocysteine S-methyltransferase family protein [Chloroflexota bacterium]
MNSPFLDRLERGPILADGAIGTLLYAQGVSPKACFEELNIAQAEAVAEVHRRYLQAGAEIIGTNTFAANRIRLAEHGLQAQVREINLQAARIARDARDLMGAPAFVAGVLGPIGIAIFEDAGSRVPVTREAYQEQIEALVDGGVDLIALETFDSLAEVEEVVLNIKSACDLPIMVQLAFNAEGRTASGETPEDVVRLLESLGVNVVGANCGAGPQTVQDVVQRMVAVAKVKVSAQPNVGQPSRAQGRYLYDSTPAQFAALARRLLEVGAWVIGGCCGTTPEHIAAMRAVLLALARAEPASHSLVVPVAMP